jgi:hypothetical protein
VCVCVCVCVCVRGGGLQICDFFEYVYVGGGLCQKWNFGRHPMAQPWLSANRQKDVACYDCQQGRNNNAGLTRLFAVFLFLCCGLSFRAKSQRSHARVLHRDCFGCLFATLPLCIWHGEFIRKRVRRASYAGTNNRGRRMGRGEMGLLCERFGCLCGECDLWRAM